MASSASAAVVGSSPHRPLPPALSDNNLQPLFVLHKAASEKEDRKSVRRRMNIAPADHQRVDAGECMDGFQEQLQREAFEFVWSKIEKTIKAVLKNINSDAFSEINSWILESFQAINSFSSTSSYEATRSFPTAIDPASKRLFTGLVLTRNMEFVDDLMTFEDLAQHLKSQGCHVANLSSLEFSADNGTGGCIRSLLRQFLLSAVDAADMSILSSWYHALGNGTPVVVIVNELERCCGSVLSDFIIMLSEWVVKIPVILIIGASTVDVPGNILHFNALRCLCSCKFTLRTPVERMDAIIEAVLVKKCSGFSISQKVAVFMRNYFTSHDGTLSAFIRALKIACAQHFVTEPLSCLLKGFDEDENQCFQEKYDFLQEAISKYNWSITSCRRRSKVDERGGKKLVSAMVELKRLQDGWSCALMCLYEAGKRSQIHLLDLLCEVLDPDLYASRSPDSNSSSRKGSFISQAIQNVRDLPEAQFINLLKSWEKHVIAIPEIHGKVKDLQYMWKFGNAKRRKEQPPDMPRTQTSQNHLNVQRASKAVNDRAAIFIEYLINDLMQPMECVPFHEIVCFKNVEKLKAALAGDPRRQIQVDLLGSCRTLHCSCCCRYRDILLPSMQDTSIMYTLSQEHGDVINLYDWYESFKLILQPTNKGKHKKQSIFSKKKDTGKSEKLNEVAIQGRFCRGVTELQIAGLLKMQSKRRPDYLQRVAFGL
ncbi:origin of replication complex subunit 3 isoform X1 [Punica granatum]|uniref:Origin of replication complex subunit 3 isoform X1 n=1 Tax=Punica granatum TaxID=22663 RepID=A0A218X386_PUNGR|nr:origin of replication complex subunit 3 isoform X1 [Punica granatum]OWM79393.1 hypothetical protein CDL15_Pgr022805 [Punica granatum]